MSDVQVFWLYSLLRDSWSQSIGIEFLHGGSAGLFGFHLNKALVKVFSFVPLGLSLLLLYRVLRSRPLSSLYITCLTWFQEQFSGTKDPCDLTRFAQMTGDTFQSYTSIKLIMSIKSLFVWKNYNPGQEPQISWGSKYSLLSN